MAKHKGEHPYHGGAWKVAYADFVTAMMALFIVLWILASSAETKAAVASYFRHPSVLKSGGTGFLTEEGMREYQEAVKRIRAAAAGDSTTREDEPEPAWNKEGVGGGDEETMLDESARTLEGLIHGSEQLDALSDQVSISFVEEGLRIQIADVEETPLYESGSATPTTRARDILSMVGAVLAPLPNEILIEGHTDSQPFAGRGNYTNWELSGDRANAARRILEESGVAAGQIASVVGYADRRPMFPDDPTSPRNRRISIIVRDGAAGR